MSLTNKALKDTFGDLLELDNSNNGVGSTAKVLKDGKGVSSALKIGTNGAVISPNADADSLLVQNAAGTNLLSVDASASSVKAGVGAARYVNSQQINFASFNQDTGAGEHDMMDVDNMLITGVGTNLGTSGDPATSLAVTSYVTVMNKFYYLPYDSIIDNVTAFVTSSADNDANVLFHLMSFDISLGNGATTTFGDLSSGTVVADHSTTLTNVNSTHMCSIALTVGGSTVAGGKVLVATVENDNSDNIYAKLCVNYHYK